MYEVMSIVNRNAALIKLSMYNGIKRLFDIIFGIIGCLLLIPIAIGIKIAFLLTKDKGPILYTQKRIGLNGKEFKFYKFRSMTENADEVLEKMLSKSKKMKLEWEKNKKLENDPRITKVGKFIRKTSLDEFPQFINVLKGDMSLIGNRPYLPREKKDMGIYFDSIESTKCGIISYWAINGRNNLCFKDRLKLESYYSKNIGFRIDIKIFIKAFKVVFKRLGAK